MLGLIETDADMTDMGENPYDDEDDIEDDRVHNQDFSAIDWASMGYTGPVKN